MLRSGLPLRDDESTPLLQRCTEFDRTIPSPRKFDSVRDMRPHDLQSVPRHLSKANAAFTPLCSAVIWLRRCASRPFPTIHIASGLYQNSSATRVRLTFSQSTLANLQSFNESVVTTIQLLKVGPAIPSVGCVTQEAHSMPSFTCSRIGLVFALRYLACRGRRTLRCGRHSQATNLWSLTFSRRCQVLVHRSAMDQRGGRRRL